MAELEDQKNEKRVAAAGSKVTEAKAEDTKTPSKK
jgi:hypothetical protein